MRRCTVLQRAQPFQIYVGTLEIKAQWTVKNCPEFEGCLVYQGPFHALNKTK